MAQPRERKWIEDKIDAENKVKLKKFNYTWKQAIRQRAVIMLCVGYVLWLAGAYGLLFFLPTMFHELTKFSLATVGYLVALTYGIGLVVLITTGKLSDQKNEKKMHIFIPMIIEIISLGLSILVYQNILLSLVTLQLQL